jgi:hypothetical protein
VTKRVIAPFAVAAVLALGAPAWAQSAVEDSVTGSGRTQDGLLSLINVDVRSDPDGANPHGQISFQAFDIVLAGPIRCLDVAGNTAAIGFTDEMFGDFIAVAIDNRPAGTTAEPADEFLAARAPTSPIDCAGELPSPLAGGPLAEGDLAVTDAQPTPTSKEQCKHGGWRTFPDFRNQVDCVSSLPHR